MPFVLIFLLMRRRRCRDESLAMPYDFDAAADAFERAAKDAIRYVPLMRYAWCFRCMTRIYGFSNAMFY